MSGEAGLADLKKSVCEAKAVLAEPAPAYDGRDQKYQEACEAVAMFVHDKPVVEAWEIIKKLGAVRAGQLPDINELEVLDSIRALADRVALECQ